MKAIVESLTKLENPVGKLPAADWSVYPSIIFSNHEAKEDESINKKFSCISCSEELCVLQYFSNTFLASLALKNFVILFKYFSTGDEKSSKVSRGNLIQTTWFSSSPKTHPRNKMRFNRRSIIWRGLSCISKLLRGTCSFSFPNDQIKWEGSCTESYRSWDLGRRFLWYDSCRKWLPKWFNNSVKWCW